MKAYLSPARPHVLAHRGFTQGGQLDENTIEAFGAALAAGATHLETDVRVTRDQVAVLFHDETLERVAGLTTSIGELTVEELAKIRLSHGGHIPTLEEALSQFPSARFNLDIKSEDGCLVAAEAINRTASWERVLVASFSTKRVRRTASLLKEPASYSPGIGVVLAVYGCSLAGLRSLARRIARDFVVLQLPTRAKFVKFASRRFLSFAHSLGLFVHFWTVNSPEEMRQLVTLGADGIVTDKADLATATLLKR